MKRTGRPPKAKKQERNIGFYVLHSEWEQIKAKIAAAGVSISDYMRQAAINSQVVMRWRAEDRQLFKDLVGICNDLHELVEIARREGSVAAMEEFGRYRSAIDEVLKRM